MRENRRQKGIVNHVQRDQKEIIEYLCAWIDGKVSWAPLLLTIKPRPFARGLQKKQRAGPTHTLVAFFPEHRFPFAHYVPLASQPFDLLIFICPAALPFLVCL